MATLTSQIKLDISGITSDPISVDKSFDFTPCLSGGITSRSINVTSAAGEKILESDEYASGTIVYLRNRHATYTISIQLSAATEIILAAGQFAMFPWVGGVDILAYASSVSGGGPILEIGVFSAA